MHGAKQSKNCLLLLIYSVSFQQESTPLLCLSLTHRHTHTHSHTATHRNLFTFKAWSIRGYTAGESCRVGLLHLAGKINWQSFSWMDQQRGRHEAWFQSQREEVSELGPGWVGTHRHITSQSRCRLSWHDSLTLDKQMHRWEIPEENNCTLKRGIVWHFWLANRLF